jgi:O-antigen/teichoic acid export membrane protein
MRVTIVPKAVETALFSRVAGHEEGRPELVAQAGRVSAIVAAVALGVLAAVAVPLVRLLLSAEFLPAVPLIWIIMPGVFLRASTMVYSAFFMGTDRPAVCSVAVGLGTLTNVGVLLLLLPVIGLAGAAWAMTAGYLVSAAVLVVSFRRATGRPVRDTWAIRREDLALLRDVPRYLMQAGRRGAAVADGPEGI